MPDKSYATNPSDDKDEVDETRLDRWRKTLDLIDRWSDTDIPACAGCFFYWEDPEAGPKTFGFCRWRAPKLEREYSAQACPPVDHDWFCGQGYQRGVHPSVIAQRAKWCQELDAAVK